MDKKYRYLTRKEAHVLAEAGACVEWTYNRHRFSYRHGEAELMPWKRLDLSDFMYTDGPIDGYEDKFRAEVE